MRDERDNLILIDGDYYSINEIRGLIESNRDLTIRCERQARFIRALKECNKELTNERNKICDKYMEQSRELKNIKSMSMFEFGNKYCSSESLEADGHAFAKALGVGQ